MNRVLEKERLAARHLGKIARKFLHLLLLSFAFASSAQTNGPLVQYGEKYTLHSKILKEDRQYWVYLPPSYKPAHTRKQYPVLYLLDGDSQFQWASQVVQFLSDSFQIPELIVVAIPNTDRNRDLTPTHDPSLASSGGGELFERFLSEELVPEISARFRPAPYRILFGHSLGGALVADTFLQQKNGFQAYIAVEPALWWDNAILLQRAKEFVPRPNSHDAVFIATASHVLDPTNAIKGDSELFISILKAKAAPFLRTGYQYFEAEDHPSSRLLGLYNGLRFIFEDYKPANFWALDTPALLNEHFNEISDRLGFEMRPPEAHVNKIADSLMDPADVDKAIECFKLNAANYPAASSVYSRLGDAYRIKGDKELAIQYYKKALELNPKMTSVKKKLEGLTVPQ